MATGSVNRHLVLIKTIHTLAWAFFVGCIIGVPLSAARGRYDWALGFGIAVCVECLILVFNAMACPLTAVAARYTTDRRPNFDIYLPQWLARWNKHIFGPLFLLGVLYSVARWRGWIG